MLFALLQTYKRAIKTMVIYFGWLLLIDLMLYIWLTPVSFYYYRTNLGFADLTSIATEESNLAFLMGNFTIKLLYFTIKLFLSFISILAIRASLEIKNPEYFILYLKKIWGYAFIFTFLVAGIYIFPLPWLCSLIYIDSSPKEKIAHIIKRGMLLIWNFLPVCFLLWFLELLLDAILGFIIISLVNIGTPWLIVGTIRFAAAYNIWFLLLCFVSVWYLTIKQSLHDLLFAQNPKQL